MQPITSNPITYAVFHMDTITLTPFLSVARQLHAKATCPDTRSFIAVLDESDLEYYQGEQPTELFEPRQQHDVYLQRTNLTLGRFGYSWLFYQAADGSNNAINDALAERVAFQQSTLPVAKQLMTREGRLIAILKD